MILLITKFFLKKLYHYGIRGTTYQWFDSYLSNRKQFVSIGNHDKSESLLITYGVPQGPVLGPLLFLLYINDFYKSIDIFDFHIFADDTNLLSSHKSLLALESEINTNLYHIAANKLSLNIEKTFHNLSSSSEKKIAKSNYILMINQLREKCALSILASL